MEKSVLLMAVVALVAVGGLVMTSSSNQGAASFDRTLSCPDGRVQLVQVENGQFARMCVNANPAAYENSPALTENIQRGVPRSATYKPDRSYSLYCDRFPNACLNE